MKADLKIFDLNAKGLPNGVIGRAMELAWPCRLYRVTLPKPDQSVESEFNIFERCILKLLAYKRYEVDELAQETCLPRDFVQLVLLLLQDHAKIDVHLRPLPGVLEEIEDQESERLLETGAYETFAVIRECVGGTLLPMLVDANLRSEELNEDDHTLGKAHVVIRSVEPSRDGPPPPTPVEIVSALRTMVRRRRASGKIGRTPSAEYVSVAADGERCWLRVRVVMQRTGDWRIVNPFGAGWSPELETAYDARLKEPRCVEAREFAVWQRQNVRADGKPSAHHESPEPYETSENIRRYPELISALRRRSDGKVSVDVHSVLEWTLYYALKETDLKRVLQLLGIMSREEAQRNLNAWLPDDPKEISMVRGLCFVPTDDALRKFLDGDAKMQTLLPISLLVAANDLSFAFNRLRVECPDVLLRIADLHNRRNQKRHGKSRWSEIYGEDDRTFMRQVVETLLPSVRFTAERHSVSTDDPEMQSVDDACLSARIALQDLFGVATFMRFDVRLQDTLINAEMFRSEHAETIGDFDAQFGVGELYEAMQGTFRPFLVGVSRVASVDYADDRAVRVGFGKLPVTLRTVRESMLRKTLDGDDQTLQACAVAWLILSDEDVLERVAARHPALLEDVNRLIVVSGHNNRRMPMTSVEFGTLCKTVYNIIRTLTEV